MSKKQITFLLALLSATNMSHAYASEYKTDKTENAENKQAMKKNPYSLFIRAGFYAGAMTIGLLMQHFAYQATKDWLLAIELIKKLETPMPYILGAGVVGIVSFALPFIEDMVCGCDKKE